MRSVHLALESEDGVHAHVTPLAHLEDELQDLSPKLFAGETMYTS